MSPSGLSACSGAPAPTRLPHGPDGAARRRRARCCRPRGRGHDRQQRYTTGRSPWRRRCPLGSPRPTARPTARPVKDTGSGGGRRRPEQRHPRPPRPRRSGTAVTWRGTGGGAAGRLRSASAFMAAASGLSAAALSHLRQSPQPSSAISGEGSPRSATSGANRFGYFRQVIGER